MPDGVVSTLPEWCSPSQWEHIGPCKHSYHCTLRVLPLALKHRTIYITTKCDVYKISNKGKDSLSTYPCARLVSYVVFKACSSPTRQVGNATKEKTWSLERLYNSLGVTWLASKSELGLKPTRLPSPPQAAMSKEESALWTGPLSGCWKALHLSYVISLWRVGGMREGQGCGGRRGDRRGEANPKGQAGSWQSQY